MGIAKFFRWLSERYPLVNQSVAEATMMPEFGAQPPRALPHLRAPSERPHAPFRTCR